MVIQSLKIDSVRRNTNGMKNNRTLPRSMAEEQVVGRDRVVMLSFTATVNPDNDNSFEDDVGVGETCTKALTLGFFSLITCRRLHFSG